MDQYIRINDRGNSVLDYDLLDVAARANLLRDLELMASEAMRAIEKPVDYYSAAMEALDAALYNVDAEIDPDTRDMLIKRLANELERKDPRTVKVNEAGAEILAPAVEEGELLTFPEFRKLLLSYNSTTDVEVSDDVVMYGGRVVAHIVKYSLRSGTAPDTSLWLGAERKMWLAAQGGIQPTIHHLIDEAMKRS